MSDTAPVIRIQGGSAHIVRDAWRLVRSAAEWDGSPDAVLPLELAMAQTERARAAGRIGVWLGPKDSPACAAELFDVVSLIGVDFPKFTDGRGYSTAMLLRTRHGWRGELRAFGDVLQDQLFAMRRVGFDSFALRADRDPVAALGAFAPFSHVYQGSADEPLPLFRRTASCT